MALERNCFCYCRKVDTSMASNHCSPSSKINIIQCEDHANKILKKLLVFYKEKKFIDVVVIAGIDNIKVQAHRLVLSASSDFFFAMFDSGMQEAKADDIVLKEFCGVTIKLIIDFMYTGVIELCCDTVESVLRAADFLQINTLMPVCCGFMGDNLDASNCLGVALIAKQYDCSALEKKAYRYAYAHFDKVWMEKEFFQLSEKQLKRIVSCDDFIPLSEETVFRSLVAWVEYDSENREKLILNLLSHIRFTELDPKFIIENRHSVCKTSKCYQLICSWLKWHLSPESRLQFSTVNTKTRKGNHKLAYAVGSISNFRVQTFNPELNCWSFEELPIPTKKRYMYSATVIHKKLIIAGGIIDGVSSNDVECLDLQTKEWMDLPPMKQGRTHLAMAELNGDLYVVGGQAGESWLQSVEKYDFVTGKWRNVAPLSTVVEWIRIAVHDGLLYAIGDYCDDMECYDPVVNKWTKKVFKKVKLENVGFAAVGEYLYAVGGTKKSDNERGSKSVDRYNPTSGTWTAVSSIEEEREEIKCIALNNRLIACGGFDGVEWVDTVEEYNPEVNKWTTLNPLLPDEFSYYDNIFIM